MADNNFSHQKKDFENIRSVFCQEMMLILVGIISDNVSKIQINNKTNTCFTCNNLDVKFS